MSLRFCIGPSGAGKSTRVYEEILKRAEADRSGHYLIIVPDQFTMQTQKVLCHMASCGGIMNVEVLSFSRLAHRIFEEMGIESLPKLDDTGKNLILRRVAGEVEEKLTVIGANMRKVGYIAQVKSMISEFSQYGIAPGDMDEFIQLSEKKGNLHAKLQDLKLLYEEYQKYIKGHFITTEETVDLLREQVHRSRILKDSVIVFDGFTGFTPIQDQLLRELLQYAKEMIVTLIGDSREQLAGAVREESLFYLSAKTYHKLEKLVADVGAVRGEDIELVKRPVRRYENNAQLSHLEQNLFRMKQSRMILEQASADMEQAATDANQASADKQEEKNISILQLPDPKAEVSWCTGAIRRLIREKNYSYRDFAVITGDLQTYGHLLKEGFAADGIPLFLDQNVSLLKHPFMVFLSSMLRMLTSDFSYENVMVFLRTGYLDFQEEEIDGFELYLKRFGIRGKRNYEKMFVRPDKNLTELNGMRQKLMEAIAPLLGCKQTAESFTEALYDICVSLDIEQKIKGQAEKFKEQGNLVRAREYEQVYGAVMGLFDQIYELLKEEMPLEEYGEILKAGFAELKVGSLPQSIDQVVAGDLERTRLKPVKVLFILGVNDGIIPGGGGSGGLLSDLERGFLLDAGIELAPTPRQKGFEERMYLYMNMTQPAEKLFLSYARINMAGETIRPSYLIRSVEKLYEGLEITCIDNLDQMEAVESRESGMILFARLLREYAAGNLTKDNRDLFFGLAETYYQTPEFSKLLEAAFYHYEALPISQENAKALFGEILRTSISRLEQFSACAYAHFLKYGLKLQEEEAFSFESVDMGNLFHETLYEYGKFLPESGYTWFTCPEDVMDSYVEKKVEAFAATYGGTILYDNARNEAMIHRVKNILKTTLHTLSFQLKKGVFEPAGYEIPFFGESTLADGSRAELYGKIDRMDTASVDGKTYVKILDYKSGRHQFDLVRLFYGLDLQLAVYMNAALKRQKSLHPGDEIIPAAILYYQLEDPMVEGAAGDGPQVILEKVHEKLKVEGLINESDEVLSLLDTSMTEESQVIPVKRKKSGELSASSQTAPRADFDLIGEYASWKISEIGKEIREGNIEAKPYDGELSACTYCGYRSICGFEGRMPGYESNHGEYTKEQAQEEMKKLLGKASDGKEVE